jgi:hypothetical protein
MAKENRFIPTSLTAKNKPSWPARQLRKLISRIDPELYEQGQNFTFDIYGIRKAVGGKFGEFGNDSNPMAIYRPGNGTGIDSAKAMANNRGFVYASVNAIGREIMNIDWRLFEVSGDDHKEQTEHELLDLLDGVNPDMTGPELKYMLSAHLDLTGNAYWYLDGVKNETDKPKAIYPLNPSQIRVIVNTESFPFSIRGYQMKLENKTINFQPYQILHFRLPNANNPFATLDGKRKEHMDLLATVPLLIIDDLGMRKLPLIAAEELLEIIMRRYERASTMITSNRPVEDWGKLLGDSAAVTAMLDRLLHHGHVLKCGPRSWRTKTGSSGDAQ